MTKGIYLELSELYYTVADPGFPVGGHAPVRGGMDLRCGHFLVKMYAKTKELGPIRGACAGHAPPRSTNATNNKYIPKITLYIGI